MSLQKMTDQAMIEKLAKFIGLEAQEMEMPFGSKETVFVPKGCKPDPIYIINNFDPLDNWNHTHLVLDCVMKEKDVWHAFCVEIQKRKKGESFHDIGRYMKATKRDLMESVISVLYSLTKHGN